MRERTLVPPLGPAQQAPRPGIDGVLDHGLVALGGFEALQEVVHVRTALGVHAMAHAQGGFEGGANYFPQRAKMNRAIAPMGKLWRAIEMHLASNAGLLAFVRLIYAKGDTGITPREVEYGLLNGPDQFRAVLFSNR